MNRLLVMLSIVLTSACTTLDGGRLGGTTAEALPVVMQAPKCRLGSTLVCKTSPKSVQDLAANCECAYTPTSFTERRTFSSLRYRR